MNRPFLFRAIFLTFLLLAFGLSSEPAFARGPHGGGGGGFHGGGSFHGGGYHGGWGGAWGGSHGSWGGRPAGWGWRGGGWGWPRYGWGWGGWGSPAAGWWGWPGWGWGGWGWGFGISLNFAPSWGYGSPYPPNYPPSQYSPGSYQPPSGDPGSGGYGDDSYDGQNASPVAQPRNSVRGPEANPSIANEANVATAPAHRAGSYSMLVSGYDSTSALHTSTPMRPEVQNVIRALRYMPPSARQRQIDSYRNFSPEEMKVIRSAANLPPGGR